MVLTFLNITIVKFYFSILFLCKMSFLDTAFPVELFDIASDWCVTFN